MSRSQDRSNPDNVVRLRTPASHLRSIRSWLGKQAAIGGRAYVERIVKSDEFASRFLNGLDGETRMAALASVAKVLAKSPQRPAPWKVGEPLRWTDELEARFRFEAPRSKDDFDLCKRMGLPRCYRHAMRRARARYGFLRGSATVNAQPSPRAASPVGGLPLAA